MYSVVYVVQNIRKEPHPMNIPKDPVMLLSFVNTALRDNYSGLEAMCNALDIKPCDIEEKLDKIGYHYDESQNQFK